VADIPAETVRIGSVSLQALPRSLVVFPVIFEGQTKAVLLLASLQEFGAAHLAFLEQLTANLGIVLNSIEAAMQTEQSTQSQLRANCRSSRRKKQTNEQLEQKGQQLAEQI
jgi:GAF domain-containing protein